MDKHAGQSANENGATANANRRRWIGLIVVVVALSGAAYGRSPLSTTNRFCYGQLDSVGNEWHVLTYWDNDVPLLSYENANAGRALGSDGYCVPVCVNPLTPIIQLSASGADQFYTTPLKTYFIPKIWDRTSYLTSGVQISFVNLTNSAAILFCVDSGSWQTWTGTSLVASALFSGSNATHLLRTKCGSSGVVSSRTIVFNPTWPAPTEQHGYLLWANETERQALIYKLNNVAPFKTSYQNCFRSDTWVQGLPATFTDQRGNWRFWPGQASCAVENALVVAVDGPASTTGGPCAIAAKQRLLWMSRLEPLGFECTIDTPTPAKDYLSELGQTEEAWTDAAIAYDILAGFYRSSQSAGGLTPIEEIQIRDGLAKVVKSLIQFRDNYSFTNGSGDTHWALGYELVIGTAALAMPTYSTSYYGVSGGDFQTANNLSDSGGYYWNPFPNQGITWYDAAFNPWVACPGYPNNVASFRSDYLLTDDGWWSGPNDLVAAPANGGRGNASDRYVQGPNGDLIVDVHYGGLANAEGRTELVEMAGYENPFTTRIAALDLIRRIKGVPTAQAGCVTSYLERRMINGCQNLTWNSTSSAGTSGYYSPDPQRVETAVYTFNHRYNFASLPGPMNLVGTFLDNLNTYYTNPSSLSASDYNLIYNDTRKIFYDAYGLIMCESPSTMPAYVPGPSQPPILKPLFRYSVAPGDPLTKYVIAIDPNGSPLTVTVAGLPSGATWNPANRSISWTPATSDLGVHIVTVTASDATGSTTRPFPICVMAGAADNLTAGSVALPAAPTAVTAALNSGSSAVVLHWTPPGGVTVAAYLIYRDGVLWAAAPAGTTTYTDSELILPSSKTRYNVSLLATNGAESGATEAATSPVEVPGPYPFSSRRSLVPRGPGR